MLPDWRRMSVEVAARIDECLGYSPPFVQMVRPVGQALMYTIWAREAHQWIVRGTLPAGSSHRECVLFADMLINVMANMRCNHETPHDP